MQSGNKTGSKLNNVSYVIVMRKRPKLEISTVFIELFILSKPGKTSLVPRLFAWGQG